jgi:hypothetical protein
MLNEKIAGERLQEARKEETGSLNLSTISLLYDMAMENVFPSGKFGDDEVCVWELFRQAKRYNENEK